MPLVDKGSREVGPDSARDSGNEDVHFSALSRECERGFGGILVGRTIMELDKKAYSILSELLDKIQEKAKGDCIGVFKDGQLISAAFFTNCLKRATYLFSASNNTAKKIGANHFLIDTYIAKNKKDSLILDFEGSMIPSLARFYASFGAENRHYFLINKNRK